MNVKLSLHPAPPPRNKNKIWKDCCKDRSGILQNKLDREKKKVHTAAKTSWIKQIRHTRAEWRVCNTRLKAHSCQFRSEAAQEQHCRSSDILPPRGWLVPSCSHTPEECTPRVTLQLVTTNMFEHQRSLNTPVRHNPPSSFYSSVQLNTDLHL